MLHFRCNIRRRRVYGENADYAKTDIVWAAAAVKCLRSSNTLRTTISDAAVARSARNGAKKGDRVAFFMVLPVFSARGGPFAAAFLYHVAGPVAAGGGCSSVLTRRCAMVFTRVKREVKTTHSSE